MADAEKKSCLDRVLDELRDPWDWVAAFIGGAIGALLSVFIHKFDLEHAIPTGALFGIGGRRAAMSSLAYRQLSKKATALKGLLKDNSIGKQTGATDTLQRALDDISYKWEAKIITNQAFEGWLVKIADADSKVKRGEDLVL